MSIEQVAVSLGELGKLVANVKEESLQKTLKTHTDAMLRNIFDHCMLKNCVNIESESAKKSISSVVESGSQPNMPSLADAAIKKINTHKSIF